MPSLSASGPTPSHTSKEDDGEDRYPTCQGPRGWEGRRPEVSAWTRTQRRPQVIKLPLRGLLVWVGWPQRNQVGSPQSFPEDRVTRFMSVPGNIRRSLALSSPCLSKATFADGLWSRWGWRRALCLCSTHFGLSLWAGGKQNPLSHSRCCALTQGWFPRLYWALLYFPTLFQVSLESLNMGSWKGKQSGALVCPGYCELGAAISPHGRERRERALTKQKGTTEPAVCLLDLRV